MLPTSGSILESGDSHLATVPRLTSQSLATRACEMDSTSLLRYRHLVFAFRRHLAARSCIAVISSSPHHLRHYTICEHMFPLNFCYEPVNDRGRGGFLPHHRAISARFRPLMITGQQVKTIHSGQNVRLVE